MTNSDNILAAFGADEALTGEQICNRTGLSVARVATYMSRLRMQGHVERVNPGPGPALHRLAGTAKLQAQMRSASRAAPPNDENEPLVSRARRVAPASVFHLGRLP